MASDRTAPLRLTRVTIDMGTETPSFAAYVRDGQLWNGWAVPYFTRPEAERVLAWTNDLARTAPEAPTIQRVGEDYEIVRPDAADGEPNETAIPITFVARRRHRGDHLGHWRHVLVLGGGPTR